CISLRRFLNQNEFGLPLPPIACDRSILRSASVLRAHTSSREAGKHASQSEAVRSSRSVILTPFSLHVLMCCIFGLPPNAPRVLSALSAWLRVQISLFENLLTSSVNGVNRALSARHVSTAKYYA